MSSVKKKKPFHNETITNQEAGDEDENTLHPQKKFIRNSKKTIVCRLDITSSHKDWEANSELTLHLNNRH